MSELTLTLPDNKPTGLVRKLAAVMAVVERIPKRGHNQFHGYHYAMESDVVEAIRGELASRNVILVPNVLSKTTRDITNRKGNTEYLTDVDVEFTFRDGDTGETITFTMSGCGQDAGDKGIYKSITGAQKYALVKFFLIPTGDDPEHDEEPREPKERVVRPPAPPQQSPPAPQQSPEPAKLTPAQLSAIHAAAGQCYPNLKGDDLHKKVHDEVCGHFEIKSLHELKPEQVKQVVQGYNKRVAKAQQGQTAS